MIEFEIGHKYKLTDPLVNITIVGELRTLSYLNAKFIILSSDLSYDATGKYCEIDLPCDPRLLVEQISKHKQIKSPFLMGYKV